MKSLINLRKEIDYIDEEILNLLLKRFEIAGLIGKIKRQENLPIVQEKRINEVINRATEKAKINNLDLNFFKNIYQVIVNESCKMEEKILRN